MKRLISIFIQAVLMTTSSYAIDLERIFEKDRDQFEMIKKEFVRLQSNYPDLNHIDHKSHSPLSTIIDCEALESIRLKMSGSGVLSVMKGDFSGSDLKDTVYIVVEVIDHPERAVQKGFVSTKGKFSEGQKTEDITFMQIDEDWYSFVRRFDHKLY